MTPQENIAVLQEMIQKCDEFIAFSNSNPPPDDRGCRRIWQTARDAALTARQSAEKRLTLEMRKLAR